MLLLQNLTLQRGAKYLIKAANVSIFSRQKVGIVGANGCGKSSLFSAIRGELTPEQGTVSLPAQLRIAYLAQETPALECSAIDYVLDGDAALRQIERQLQRAQHNNDGDLIATLHAELDAIDGYTAKARAAQLLDGLGFAPDDIDRPVKAFSGGWRMRLNLAQALMCPSDLLLLDEPTNHLDLDAVIWLESWLQKYPGTLLFISHDREFLDNVSDHILHFERAGVKLYTGNYSAFEAQRAAQLALQQAAYLKQQQKREHLQSFIDRFRAKASKARQAQSRLKALAKMETVMAVHAESPFEFTFKAPQKNPHPLINLEKADIGYADKIILREVNLQIKPGARIGLLGPNGAGKTTLIRCLAGELAAAGGKYEKHSDTQTGYFAQHQVDTLTAENTPMQHLAKVAPAAREQELRNFLGGFAFSGDMANSKIGLFSGGEKARLALALIVWKRPNLLLLDEPTNHLDLEMRAALTLALQDYVGAMVVVSHDRHLLRTTTDELLLVAQGKVGPFNDDLTAYEKWLLQFRKAAATDSVAATAAPQPVLAPAADQRKQARQLIAKLQTLEKRMQQWQASLEAVDKTLADSTLYAEGQQEKLAACLAERQQLLGNLQEAEQEWLDLSERLETM